MDTIPVFRNFSQMALPNKRCTKKRKMVATFFIGQKVHTTALDCTVVGFCDEDTSIVALRDGTEASYVVLNPFKHIVCCGAVPENIRRAAEARGF